MGSSRKSRSYIPVRAREQSLGREVWESDRPEETTIRTEGCFGSLFDRVPIGVYRSTPDGQFLDVNQTLVESLGHPDRQSLLKIKVGDLYVSNEDRIRWKSMMTVEGEVRGWEVRLRSYDKSIVFFEENSRAIEDANGRVVYYEGTLNDITERKRAERALRESERRYRLIFENIQDVYFETELDGTITEVSPSVEQISGYTRDELIGSSMLGLHVHLRQGEQIIKAIEKHGLVRDFEILLKDRDGNLLPCSINARLLYDESGIAARTCGTLRDISERKRAEEERDRLLHETEERVRELMCMYEVARTIRDRDRSLEEVFLRVATLLPPAWRYPEITRAKIRFDGEEYTPKPFAESVWKQTADIVVGGDCRGAVEVYYLEPRPALDEGPFPIATRNLIDGIADALSEAIEHRRTEERFRLAASSTSDLIYEWEVASDRLDWFGDIDSKLGFEPGELPRTVDAWLSRIHPEDQERLSNIVDHHRLSADPVDVEYRIQHSSGQWQQWSDRGMMVLDRHGNPARLVGACTDISERKLAEQKRLELERQVQHAQKLESLGVLAGGIAHDFNNLLMGVLGNAELTLISLPPASPARTYVEGIENAARRAAVLSTQMLAYSGKGKFVVEPVDLSVTIEEMSQLLSASITKKVELRYHLASELPLVEADLSQLRQVVLNLVTNASEAIGQGTGTITISTSSRECDSGFFSETYVDDQLPAGCYVELAVCDDGCGMDAETQQRIFEPFFTTKFTGRGLGLAALLGIVRGHRGAVKVESTPDQSTTVTVLFPCCERVALDVEQPVVADDWRGSGTILLVDDEKTVREVAQDMLKMLGFEVRVACDGAEAIEVFRRHADDIDLVLLDMKMPRMSGEEVFPELQEIKKDTKVILCSGYNEQRATQHLVGRGLAAFIHKPYQLATLRQKIREALEG